MSNLNHLSVSGDQVSRASFNSESSPSTCSTLPLESANDLGDFSLGENRPFSPQFTDEGSFAFFSSVVSNDQSQVSSSSGSSPIFGSLFQPVISSSVPSMMDSSSSSHPLQTRHVGVVSSVTSSQNRDLQASSLLFDFPVTLEFSSGEEGERVQERIQSNTMQINFLEAHIKELASRTQILLNSLLSQMPGVKEKIQLISDNVQYLLILRKSYTQVIQNHTNKEEWSYAMQASMKWLQEVQDIVNQAEATNTEISGLLLPYAQAHQQALPSQHQS